MYLHVPVIAKLATAENRIPKHVLQSSLRYSSHGKGSKLNLEACTSNFVTLLLIFRKCK